MTDEEREDYLRETDQDEDFNRREARDDYLDSLEREDEEDEDDA